MKISKLLNRPTYIVLTYLVLLIFLLTTSPAKLPIALLMLPLLLMFIGLFMTVQLVLHRVMPKTARKRQNLYAAYAGGLPVFLLILSSVGQLTWRDVSLVMFLGLCLLFYTSRAHFGKKL